MPGSEVEIAVPFFVRPGDRVFKTHDEQLISEAQLSFTGPGRLKVPIRVVVRARQGEPLELEAIDAKGIRAAVKGTLPGAIALKHPLTPEAARAQIERLGNTPFTLAGLDCDLDGIAMFPLSELNTVRRDLTTALQSARLDRFRRVLPDGVEEAKAALLSSLHQDATQDFHRPPADPVLAVAVADYTGLEAAIDGGASAVYFGGLSYRRRDAWNRGSVERAADLCRANNIRAYLLLPRIWKDDQHPGVAEWLDTAVKLRAAGVEAGDLGGLRLATQSGLETVTDLSIPVFNDLAIQLLLRQGAARLTLSPELNREQLRNFRFRGAPCLEMVVHGTLPLMVSEYCPVGAVTGAKSAGSGAREPSGSGRGDRCPGTCRRTPCFLEDRQGYRFPLQLDEHCRMTLYNARELCLIEHLGDIIQDGYGSLRLDLRSHKANAVREITRIYARALKSLLSGAWNGSDARQAWEQLDRLSVTGLTRGHYLRGVINQESAVRSQ
jgi:putative protease